MPQDRRESDYFQGQREASEWSEQGGKVVAGGVEAARVEPHGPFVGRVLA